VPLVGLELTVHSVRCEAAPHSAGQPVREALAEFLADLAGRLVTRGCTFIGHIKGRAVAEGEEPLFFSLTRPGAEPQFKGGGWDKADSWELSMSVILAGLSEEEISQAMQETLKTHFQIFSGEAKA
jgi:hypothetical protein